MSRSIETRSFPLHRLWADVCRFRTRPFSEFTLGHLPGGSLARRRLFGYTAWLDLSRSSMHRLLYLEGERMIGESHLLSGLVRPGSVVVDVGANVGYYMLLFARLVGPQGRVVCFEPEPENLVELKRNREANGLAQVEVRHAAVGERDGTVSFRTGLNGVVAGDSDGDLKAAIVQLDSALEVPPDLIKVDVEGYEGQVLEGAATLIERHRPTLFVEVHPWRLYPPWTVRSLLDRLRASYSSVEVYGLRPEVGLTEKVRQRYLGTDPVERVANPEATLEALQGEGVPTRSYWIVCRSDAAAPAFSEDSAHDRSAPKRPA